MRGRHLDLAGRFRRHPRSPHPRWWNTDESQFGRLKRWTVTADGALLDGHPLSATRLADLDLARSPLTTVRVGVDPAGPRAGSLNLFGRGFGNQPQDILMEIQYADPHGGLPPDTGGNGHATPPIATEDPR